LRNQIQRRRSEKGFTLIELLVVIVILGILAAVVVFAVGGIKDKGNDSACKIDTRTLRTAEEAYSAQSSAAYTDPATLKSAGLLSEYNAATALHSVTFNNATTPPTYTIKVTQPGIDGKCDKNATPAVGDVVDGTNVL
jgi:prepilin-type N-terminal cleavage/methylation domain-containing protein